MFSFVNSLSLWGLVSMGQMASVGKVKAHQSLVRPHDSLVCLKIGRAAAQCLDIDSPLLRVKSEGLESSCLAKQLHAIDLLVSAVVSGAWVTFGVFVGHGRTQCIEDSSGCDIFGGNEEDGFALTLDFFLLRPCEIMFV